MNLNEAAHEMGQRLGRLFRANVVGVRPCQGPERQFAEERYWRDMAWFYDYFDGGTGRGLRPIIRRRGRPWSRACSRTAHASG